jgi:hypothetical protein
MYRRTRIVTHNEFNAILNCKVQFKWNVVDSCTIEILLSLIKPYERQELNSPISSEAWGVTSFIMQQV